MPSHVEEDWSDSDDENVSEVETSVSLGVPDGPIEAASDLRDAAVSRLGGHPAFLLSREPPISSSQCKSCSFPMELLVQLWCPLEDSPMDRALFVWGCARSGCQRKDGSVRAWRGLKRNEKYAAKLEEKRARQREKEAVWAAEEAKRLAEKSALKANPFSMKSNTSAGTGPFGVGLGTQLFGGASASSDHNDTAEAPDREVDAEDAPDDEAGDSDSESSSASSDNDPASDSEVVIAMASATLADSPWAAAPAYSPIYLSTTAEYLPPTPKAALPRDVQVQDPALEDEGKGKNASWAFEGYENSLEVDHVFERFMKRVACEGTQCVRYELGGTPLPFGSDAVFTTLFPLPSASSLPVTRQWSKVVAPAPKQTYVPQGIAPCPRCGTPRVFECQLMPNLINVLESSSSSGKKQAPQTDAERRKEVEQALRGNGAGAEGRGMEWGTCLIFSCERDCCLVDGEEVGKECWREEIVLVQWDD